MQLFYFTFTETHKASEYNRFAIIAEDLASATIKAEKIGIDPTIDGEPHQLSDQW